MSIRAFVDRIRRTPHPDHLSFIASGAVFVLMWSGLKAPSADRWLTYAIIGVVLPLLLWRVAKQWKVESQEAENLRAIVIMVCALAGATIVWLFTHK
jgi:hypothetical protein